jgi:hypothetical protein
MPKSFQCPTCAAPNVKYEDVVKVIDTVKGAKAYPIGLGYPAGVRDVFEKEIKNK